jgi:hypothetical protein
MPFVGFERAILLSLGSSVVYPVLYETYFFIYYI